MMYIALYTHKNVMIAEKDTRNDSVAQQDSKIAYTHTETDTACEYTKITSCNRDTRWCSKCNKRIGVQKDSRINTIAYVSMDVY